MCFSATASFTASALLATAGTVLVKRCWRDSRRFIALVPCLFAIQQFAEGLVWVAFDRQLYPNYWSAAAQFVFLFVASPFWPLWIPFAMAWSEPIFWRKTSMWLLLVFSAAVFALDLSLALPLLTHPADFLNPSAAWHVSLSNCGPFGCSLHYSFPSYDQISPLFLYFYLTAAVMPWLLSSLPRMWLVGLLLALSYVVARVAYEEAFVSVWCFFGALVTILLLAVLKKRPETSTRSIP